MPLAHGRPYLAIPGPSVMPDRVLAAMHRAAPNIYDGPLPEMVAGLWPDLKRLAGCSGHVGIWLANGHGAWEAANSNLFSRGDRALLLSTGKFGLGWSESLKPLGVQVEMLDFGKSVPVDLNRVEAALRADRAHGIKALLVSHVDTSSGVKNDIPALRALLDTLGHPALLAVDGVASMGCDEMRMDDWGVDLIVGASQKGLMVPPGLGFLWVSDRAVTQCRGSDLRTPYWDWDSRFSATEFWQHWFGTAPTHHLFGLRESLDMIFEEGLEAVWARHGALARAVWAAFDAWGAGHPEIALNVADPAHRSHAVTAARIGPAPNATRLRHWTEAKAGVTLGIGLGMTGPGDPAGDAFLRVAHMGHVNAHMTLGALAVMEAGMQALEIPHGAGALEAAAGAVARFVAGAA
ncbi:MAG: alanine--glyoxylate aminotransferase family protein [Gemmobacter sp.]|uniref:pyridoxal-phosphate-dependent aminotransferase family protein n=1 Tax=Gemmobacter sp. TaxID=1898957 RepID=UPI001A5CC382|nr:aminotransferase class V-fold PLP-dependent enzyme [Gemmobacter sp.]MBL8560736.1 alanine--glyoxylate aminotransferase family protein [Gemmobacter sp.]